MRLRQKGRRLWRWLWKGRVLIVGIFWPILLLSLCYLLFPSFSSALSTAGTLLQLSGFVLIALGIKRVANIFKRRSLSQRAWDWMRDLKEVWSPSSIVAEGSTARASAQAHGGVGEVGYPDAETLEERVSVLESSMENLKRGHDALREMAKKRTNSLESRIDKQGKEHTRKREEILDKLEKVAAAGLDWEFVAVVWLGLGVSLRYLSSWL